MPDFANVPTGWVTDRYEPDSFSNVGTFQGRDNVLGIGISSDDGLGSRGPSFNSQFYNTQGRKQAISGGAGSILAADLYVPEEWEDSNNGHRRTDMWGTMTDAGGGVVAYPIIGFTNYGGAGRYQAWDDTLGWIDLGVATYGEWTSFAIEFTGSAFVYSINGAVVHTDNTVGGATGFSEVIMQAYNFTGDPSLQAIAGDQFGNYTAYWSNAQVPEPAALALLGLGLVGVAARRRRA